MAAVFVCNALNLPTDFQNHAAYVTGWLKKLREDKREVLRARLMQSGSPNTRWLTTRLSKPNS
jgi:antirestriction protein ArdC